MQKLKIYLAGPDVFRKDAIQHLNSLKEISNKYGYEGLAPLDNIIEVSDVDKFTPVHSNLIFKSNVNLIKQCDIIIANIIPFRGACIDDGTAWEIGYGFALGKKIYGYTKYNKSSLLDITISKFKIGKKQKKYSEVENFGNCVNLMISDSIVSSGGKILKTFEKCLIDISKSK